MLTTKVKTPPKKTETKKNKKQTPSWKRIWKEPRQHNNLKTNIKPKSL